MAEEMNVLNVIDVQTVLPHLEATNKSEALEKMAEALTKAGYLRDAAGFLKDVYQREQEGCTGIGGYIAIPHGKSAHVEKIGVAVATIDQEIPWETLDDNGVRVIVLFAVGDDAASANEHLKLLAMFAKKLGRETVVEALLKADTIDDVMEAFKN